MKTIEEYAIDLVCDGATSLAEDDMNEDDEIADGPDHRAACALAEKIARAIRANPGPVLALVQPGSPELAASAACDGAIDLGDENTPVDPCVRPLGHPGVHQTADGRQWVDDDED